MVLLLLDVELEDSCAFTIIVDVYNENAHRPIMKNKNTNTLLLPPLLIAFLSEMAISVLISIIFEVKNKQSKYF